TEFCDVDSLLLVADSGFQSYMWSTGEANDSIFAKTGGNFSVTVTNQIGCSGTSQISLATLPTPTVSVSAVQTTIQRGESVMLTAMGAINYSWSPALSLDDASSASPTATPDTTTTYTVTGVNTDSCSASAIITITVEDLVTENDIQAKRLFTPNGDGINDFWVIDNIEKFSDCMVIVFNRQGKTILETQSYANDWDGTLNGKELSQGVYYYVIRCDGDENLKTGSITIIR
ncbi:MAG: gliding motility-associated C-terminal domain-containing protein, partial [Bacteroidetes bacterium]|nr:gliding motility-associated C-terminal domain-containing protein [Bacteroidota bacterium]